MRLYSWHSQVFANYARGVLIACAESPAAAREQLRNAFETALEQKHSWLFGEFQDDNDRAQIESHRLTFEQDLAAEPTISDTLILEGGE